MTAGRTILGRFRVERELRADDASDGGAPLLVRAIGEGDERLVLRPVSRSAARGADRLVGLEHPALARIRGVEGAGPDESLYLASDYVEGTDLAARLADGLSHRAAAIVCRDVVSGLRHLHGLGLVHGDVKPENVIVTEEGGGVLFDPILPGDEDGARGTLHYLAPERLLSGEPDPSADLYAVGVILFQQLARELPFLGDTPLELVRAIQHGVSEPRAAPTGEADDLSSERAHELAGLAVALLDRTPALRPAGAPAVYRRLCEILGEEPPEPGPADYATALLETRPVLADRVRAQLESHLDRLVGGAGRPGVLLIAGPTGSGRTTHLAQVRSDAVHRGFMCLHLRGSDAGPAELSHTLARLLERDVAKDPAAALRRVAIDAPVLLLVDDFHRASPALLELVRELLDEPLDRPARLGIVLSGEADTSLLALPRGTVSESDVVTISPLQEAELAAFLKRALPDLFAPEALAAEVVKRTGGRPASMLALLSRYAAAGGFRHDGGSVFADLGRLERLGADPAARATGQALLDSVASSSREVLELLAVAGVPVSREELSAVTGRSALELATALAPLLLRRVVRALGPGGDPVELAFEDDVAAVRKCLEPGSSGGGGGQRARELARRLLAREGTRCGDLLAAVGRLLEQSSSEAAGCFLARAAGLRLQEGKHVEALGEIDRAIRARLRLGERLSVRVLRARGLAGGADLEEAAAALAAVASESTGELARSVEYDHAKLLGDAGRSEESLAALDRALARTDLGDLRSLRATRAWMLYSSGRGEEANAAIDELLAAEDPSLGDEATDASLEVFATAAALFENRGDRRRARIASVRARRIARWLGRHARAAHFDSQIGHFDRSGGREVLGGRRMRRAIDTLERSADRRNLPHALMRYGFYLFDRSEYEPALDAFRRAAILFERAQSSFGVGWARNGEGLARLALGEPERAAANFEESLEKRRAARSYVGAGRAAVNLYRAHTALGHPRRGRAAALQAFELAKEPGREPARVELFLALAETAALSRASNALLFGYAERARALATEPDGLATSEILVGESKLRAGELDEAMRLARSARRRARAGDLFKHLALATALRAGASLYRGRVVAARRAFDSALRIATDPAAAIDVRLSYARAVFLASSRGNTSETAAGRTIADEASRAAALRGDRARATVGRELATSLGSAFAHREGDADLTRENQALRRVLQASRWINQAESVEEVLNRIIDAAVELTGASRGFVVSQTDGAPDMKFMAARNVKREDILEPGHQLSRSIVEEAMRTGRTVVTSEARADARFRDFHSISSLDLLSVLCAPLKNGDRTVGAIYVDDPARVDRFGAEARERIEALAEQAAIALDKARLRAEVEELVAQRTQELQKAQGDLAKARLDLEERYAARQMVTQDPGLRRVIETVERVANNDLPVLILGEPGTGKELVARGVHFTSDRRKKTFVAVNCASLPESLVESELFGSKRGAFSGAQRDREGLIAAADGGTLFLDEIAELPMAMQAKFLRVLQGGEFLPLGANRPQTSDFRLLAATNRSLVELIDKKLFREDLYYRLKGIQIDVPPLRERHGDVQLLVGHFARQIAAKSNEPVRRFTAAALAALAAYPWPGNVRELESALQALLLTNPNDPIDVSDLPSDLRGGAAQSTSLSVGGEPELPLKERLRVTERDAVVKALEQHGGDRGRAAEQLGITRRWLLKLIEKHELE